MTMPFVNERFDLLRTDVSRKLKELDTRGSLVQSAGQLVRAEAKHPEDTRVNWLGTSLPQGIRGCVECPLGPMRMARAEMSTSYGRQQGRAVPGEGRVGALAFAMGDRPGMLEDQTGKPVVGPTAVAFDQVLAFLELDREKDVYLTNAVKCQPPNTREPNKGEWCRCSSMWLHRQIMCVNPVVIMVFGNVAFEALMQTKSMLKAEPKDCRGDYTAAKNFDTFGERLLDYPLTPTIKVWWARHYASLARDDKDRVRYAESFLPLREALRKFRSASGTRN